MGSYKLCTHLTHLHAAKKGYTHPHPPTPCQKWSYQPTSAHSQSEKGHPTHTHSRKVQTPTRIHIQTKNGHTHPCITEKKNAACLMHNIYKKTISISQY